MDPSLEELLAIADPAERARRATDLITAYQQRAVELGRIRRAAVDELHARGLSYAELAMAIGLSKGRIGQIKQAPALRGRALFGTGPVLLALPPGSEDGGADDLVRVLTALQLAVNRGVIRGDRGDAVVLHGAGRREADAVLRADPVLDLKDAGSERGRAIRLRSRSSRLELPPEPAALGYLARRTGRTGVTWDLAGLGAEPLRAAGLRAAVRYLAAHPSELWEQIGPRSATLVVAAPTAPTAWNAPEDGSVSPDMPRVVIGPLLHPAEPVPPPPGATRRPTRRRSGSRIARSDDPSPQQS